MRVSFTWLGSIFLANFYAKLCKMLHTVSLRDAGYHRAWRTNIPR